MAGLIWRWWSGISVFAGVFVAPMLFMWFTGSRVLVWLGWPIRYAWAWFLCRPVLREGWLPARPTAWTVFGLSLVLGLVILGDLLSLWVLHPGWFVALEAWQTPVYPWFDFLPRFRLMERPGYLWLLAVWTIAEGGAASLAIRRMDQSESPDGPERPAREAGMSDPDTRTKARTKEGSFRSESKELVLTLLAASETGASADFARRVDSVRSGVSTREMDAIWTELVELIRFHGLEAFAVRRVGDELPGPIVDELEPAHLRTALHSTLLLESAGRTRALLGGAGIPSLLFKGAALMVSGAYSRPGARRMDDVDLLVPAERADEAVDLLLDAGYRPWSAWRGEATRRWVDSATFDDPEGPDAMPLTLDLHWRTAYGSLVFGGEDEGEASILWKGADLEEGLPHPTVHLAMIAEHVVKHLRFTTHFVGIADLGVLAGRIDDWERFVEIMAARPMGHAVGLLLDGCARELGYPVPEAVVSALVREGRVARWGRRFLLPSRLVGRRRAADSRVAGLALRWLLTPSVGTIAGDVADALFPDRRWLAARYGALSGGGKDGAPGWPSALGLWFRYVSDVVRWLALGRSSPASPNQHLIPLDEFRSP